MTRARGTYSCYSIKNSQQELVTRKKVWSHLKKPRDLEIKVIARRLKKMPYKIPLMRFIDSKALDDHVLVDILARASL